MRHDDVVAACEIYERWDALARSGDIEGLLALYTPDATFESPLVPRLMKRADGTLRGHEEIRAFIVRGTERRPNELVRWHRTGEVLTDGHLLFWEYPRETPDGDQVDIAEMMEIVNGRIQHHRIYWGWRGFALLSEG
jgi:hypothetical protein